MDVLDRITELFAQHGAVPHAGQLRCSVSALEHALQCAQQAEWADARAELVAAALLHDIGHFMAEHSKASPFDDLHELRSVKLLDADFGPGVIEPIRLHVHAKRYLVAVEHGYEARLSPASAHSLQQQGGPMTRDEVRVFEALPFASEAVALRRWDDLAQEPGKRTPSLDYYLELLASVRRGAGEGLRIGIGALDLA
jgi:predicted HD phosphohydrolase